MDPPVCWRAQRNGDGGDDGVQDLFVECAHDGSRLDGQAAARALLRAASRVGLHHHRFAPGPGSPAERCFGISFANIMCCVCVLSKR